MKQMKCIDCHEGNFKAETSEEMMKAMMPHYMEKHKEMMAGNSKESKEEWMKRFNEEWDKTKEN